MSVNMAYVFPAGAGMNRSDLRRMSLPYSVFPAGAGMNRTPDNTQCGRRVPRRRGDEPLTHISAERIFSVVFPAGAGMNRFMLSCIGP